MSDKPKQDNDDFMKQIGEKAELQTLRDETAAKRAVLDHKIVKARLENLEQQEKELEIAKSASYGALSPEEIAKITTDNQEYLEAAKNPMSFICKTFDEIIPFFRKNVILVGAKTGEGKSTAVANIAFNAISTKHKVTGKTLRTLVITNEEKREDFYNRITSLVKGWHYTNHSKFTQEQIDEFNRMIPILAGGGRLTVIDNSHGGSHGVTTTIEGMETLFERLLADENKYDVIMIDYYQNIIGSKLNPSMDQYKVQERFAKSLDNFKNLYPAPIVVMAQMKSQSEKDQAPFQIRLMGSKSIMVPSTVAMEMVVDRKNLRTKWIIHKSRYTEGVGNEEFTGYDKGRFVEYTNAFAENVQKMAYEKEARRINGTIDKSNGIKDVKFGEGNGTGEGQKV